MIPATILLVDDDEGLLRLHQLVLKNRAGFDVQVAASGQAALEQISRRQPDLVILDLMMPDMGGIEICCWMRARPELAAIPIVILTGLSDEAAHRTALESGANAVWLKPLALSDLTTRIIQILAAR